MFGQFASRKAKTPDGSQRIVGIKVHPAQRWKLLSPIHIPTRDARAEAVFGEGAFLGQLREVRKLDDRIDILRALGARFEMVKSFPHTPAVVPSFDDDVHLLPLVLPHIAGP